VRFVDASPVFRVIYDALNTALAELDLVGASATLRVVYAYDGAPVSGGVVCLNDSGRAVCTTTNTTGHAVVVFNRFANGTVSYINATDHNSLVYTTLLAPRAPIVVKSVSPDLYVSIISTINATYIKHLELPGLVKVVVEISGHASIYVNTTLKPVLVKVNGRPSSFSYVDGVVVLYIPASTVEIYYSTPVEALLAPGTAPTGVVYEIGFADKPVLENATLRVGVLVNSSSVTPVLRYGNESYYGSGLVGFSYPLFVALSWHCENGIIEISYMLTYTLWNYTYTVTSRHVFAEVSVVCPAKLYPYLAVLGGTEGIVDKYGAVPSETLRYLALGTLKITVQGPIPAGGLIKFLVLNSPIRLVYRHGGIDVEPGGRLPVTLVGFRGFTLSYSVAGATVTNVLIATNELPLYFPYGVALMVIVDPSSRTISIVQVAAPAPPVVLETTAVPWIALPTIQSRPVVQPDWGAPEFIVLYGAMVAVAVLASKLTGSVLRGVMLSSLVFGLVLFGIGVYTGNLSVLGTSLLIFILATGAEIARRQAG
jgi:hypothetical protein